MIQMKRAVMIRRFLIKGLRMIRGLMAVFFFFFFSVDEIRYKFLLGLHQYLYFSISSSVEALWISLESG